MNAPLQELWEKATSTVVPRDGKFVSVSAQNIEKFAELVIRECANVTGDSASIVAIKKYFGVK